MCVVCDALLSLNIMFLRFIHFGAHSCIDSFSVLSYSIRICHDLCILPLVDEHLGCFRFGAIMIS